MLSARIMLQTLLVAGIGIQQSAWVYAEVSRYQALSALVDYPERSAPATVHSLNDSVISSQLSAVVNNVKVRVSQLVEKGDVLVELDCTDFLLAKDMASARLESARATRALAQSQFDRAEELHKKALTSQQQFDSRKAELLSSAAMVKQQRVALKQAQVHVDRCQVRAPFAGIVTRRLVSTGQLASPGQALIAIVDSHQLELSASIATADYNALGEISDFIFDFGQQLPVKLHNTGGVIDSQTRNIETRFLFTGAKPLPGTAGRLRWHDPRPFVPARYLVKRNGQTGLFVYDENSGTVSFLPLAEAIFGRPAAVDLPLSTLVVTDKLGALETGDTLQ